MRYLGLLVPLVWVTMLIILAARSLRVVPEQHAYVVERLGRYFSTLQAGVHILVPFVDAVRHKHSLAEQTIAVPGEACRTRDERQVWIDGLVTAKVADPRRASYETTDYRAAVGQLARTILRRRVADVELDRLHADRDVTCAAIAADLRTAAGAWGVAVLRYDMTDISRHHKESAA